MAEKDIKWTEQQRRAIAARGSDVLVTASAGTGKTAVLSGRCVNIVSDRTICRDVWSILVLTFTEMAAEQMRSRIAGQLRAEFLRNKDPHLRHQLMLLQGADISTIHSFCKRLITEYFYKLALDPTFRVIDGDEQKLLKAEVLEKTIDWAWQQSSLQQALERLLYRRDLRTNDGFLAKIIDLSDFLDGVVSRQKWYERTSLLTEAVDPFTTKLGERQKEIVAGKLQHILNQVRHAQKLYENESTGGDWAKKWEEIFVGRVSKCIKLLQAGDWHRCAEEIINFQKPSRFEYKPRGLDGPVAEIIRKTARSAKNAFERLSDLAVLNPEYLDKVSGAVGLQTKVLVELVKKFDRLYSQAKRAVNCLDFADLEHYALELLTDENSSQDNLLPSETALALRRKYKYIFVDEYQDINPVQQAILDLLSSSGNVFVVGDVKQSIYAWRGAEPEIFLQRLEPASVDPANAPKGLRVDLNANFRSAKGILDFVNKVFARIMTASFTKIDYDESAKLKSAGEYKSKEPPPNAERGVVEFHILDDFNHELTRIDSNKKDSEKFVKIRENSWLNAISNRQRQAAMIAQRIRQMVGAETDKPEFQIYDKQQGGFRDVDYRDIVILMRSLAKKANDYVEVLRLAGVPVSCEATAGYFETTEISDCLCLLKVLDNPQRDIELAAVLRSPFFKISDTELVKIKANSKTDQQRRNFYDCVLQYCTCGPRGRLAERLKKILARIEQWRTLARRGNLADLIWQIYRQTDFLSFVSALPNGQARRANLLKLHDRAIQFEGFASSAGIPQLSRFVAFIEKLQEVGQDWAPAEPDSSVENAVRIISVHKSKGLEFPVVFLAELDSKFNKRDIQEDFLADATDTLGLQIIDRQSNSKLSSLAHQVIAEQKLSTALAEEMRILYVATTRARDRLILTASQKRNNCRNIISNAFYSLCVVRDAYCVKGNTQSILRSSTTTKDEYDIRNTQYAIRDWQLRSCESPLEWLLYGLCDQKNLHNAFETGLAPLETHPVRSKTATSNGAQRKKSLTGLADKANDDDLFSLKLYSQTELKQLSRYILKLKANKSSRFAPHLRHSSPRRVGAKNLYKQTEPELLWQVKESLAWRYRFGDAPLLPAKLSVTQLTHRGDEYVRVAASKAKPLEMVGATLGGRPDVGLIGTATHLVIAQLDLTPPRRITKEAVEKIKEKLLADGAVAEAVVRHINTESIIAFFESKLGRMALNVENVVWREWPFTFVLPASFVARRSSLVARTTGHESRGTDDEVVILQGIIDMLVQTPDGLLVIDFKTDNVSAEQAQERARVYREQLELYSRAASAILKAKRVTGSLYFLTPGCAIEVT